MKKKILAIQGSEINRINYNTDTSLFLALEAKKSSIEKNKRRIKLSEKDLQKRSKLKSLIMDKKTSIDDRFQAQLKLSKLRRNGARTRVRNRCELTGRPRGYHKRVRLSRIALRDLASKGQIPGMNKSSW